MELLALVLLELETNFSTKNDLRPVGISHSRAGEIQLAAVEWD